MTKLILATKHIDGSNGSEWNSRYADQLCTGVLVIAAEASHGFCHTSWANGRIVSFRSVPSLIVM